MNELVREGASLKSANVGCANADDAKALLGAARAREYHALAANPEYKRMRYVTRSGEEKVFKTIDATSVFSYVIESRKAKKPPEISTKELGLVTETIFSDSAKLAASEKWGYWTPALYLASGTVAESGKDLCPHASDGCRLNCLLVSGQREMQANTSDAVTQRLRAGKYLSFPTNLSLLRTYSYRYDYENFEKLLTDGIDKEIKRAARKGLKFALRLNATSDLPWENSGIMQKYPQVPFYDYTKIPQRAVSFSQSAAPNHFAHPQYKIKSANPLKASWSNEEWPANYHISFSYSEVNLAWCLILLGHGVNIVVPFTRTLGSERWRFIDPEARDPNWDILPKTFLGRPVIDGDAYDIRFIDNAFWAEDLKKCPPYIVGLRVKGNYQREPANKNGFFFDGKAAQAFGSDPDFIAGHLAQNTRENLRQNDGKTGMLPTLDLAKQYLHPKLFAAYESARRG